MGLLKKKKKRKLYVPEDNKLIVPEASEEEIDRLIKSAKNRKDPLDEPLKKDVSFAELMEVTKKNMKINAPNINKAIDNLTGKKD